MLEKQKKELEQKAQTADKKVILFDMIIDIAEKEFEIPIRKKYSPEQSTSSEKKTKKQTGTCGLVGVNRQVYNKQTTRKKNGL